MQKTALLCTLVVALAACASQDSPPEERTDSVSQELYYGNATVLWPQSPSYPAVIPMCWHQYIGFDNPTERAALKSFVVRTLQEGWANRLNMKISWVDCPTSGSATHVRVLLRSATDGPHGTTVYGGMATLTNAAQRTVSSPAPPGFLIGVAPWWNYDDTSRTAFRAILLHEFGHVLGFGHEQDHPSATPATSPCHAAGAPDPSGIPVGPPDPQSIMGYSYCSSALSTLSINDIVNARTIYGTSPIREGILWRDASNSIAVWHMNGSEIVEEGYPGSVPSNWQSIAVGDFDNNGRGDIMYRRTSDGQIFLWLMSGLGTYIQSMPPRLVGAGWSVKGVGDFDGDGKDDVLWRDSTGQLAMWFMNGSSIVDSYPPLVSNSWVIEAVGRMDPGNSMADILWRDTTNGQLAIWYMNGVSYTAAYPPIVGSDWKVLGVGDFNGDGRGDIFWRQTSTGQTAVWLMNGVAYTAHYPGVVGSDFVVFGVADYDADGKADILWRQTTGQPAIWFMNGGAVREQGYPLLAPTAWTMLGPMRSKR